MILRNSHPWIATTVACVSLQLGCAEIWGIKDVEEITEAGVPSTGVVTLATDADARPVALAVYKEYVYWTGKTGGAVKKVARTGGEVQTLVEAVQGSGSDIIVHSVLTETRVIWTRSQDLSHSGDAGPRSDQWGSVHTVLTDGTDPTVVATRIPSGVAGDEFDPTFILGYNQYVVWTCREANRLYQSAAKDTDKHSVVDEASAIEPLGLAENNGVLFWANYVSGSNSGTIKTFVIGNPSTGTTVASNQTGPYQVAFHDNHVYWTNEAGNAIMRAKTGGNDPETLASSQASPRGIAVNSDYVYWTNYTGNTVMKLSLASVDAGGVEETVADGQSGPNDIALDDDYVYWVNETSGTIMRADL